MVASGTRHSCPAGGCTNTLSEMERVGSAYSDRTADDYFAYQAPIGRLGATLNTWKFADHVKASDTVVDFGCGAGGLLENLAASERIGVEASEPARRAAQASGLVRTVPTLSDLGDETADVVISNHALEHTLSPYVELREMLRVLRPGGRLVLWLPLDDWRADRATTNDVDHHLYTWTPMLIRNLLTEAGFSVIDARVVTHAWPPKTERLVRLPRRVFDALSWVWAVLRHRRQVMAMATKPLSAVTLHGG